MRRTVGLLLGIALLCGCMGGRGAQPGPFGAPDSAAARMRALESRLQRTTARQDQLEDLIRSMHADLSAQLADMAAEVTTVSERFAAQERWIASLARRSSRAAEAPAGDLLPPAGSGAVFLDSARTDLPPWSLGTGARPRLAADSARGMAEGRSRWSRATERGDTLIGGATAPPVPGGQLPPDPPEEGIRLYEVAYDDLKRDNYQLALINFRAFLESYPGTALADNAQYWIGEAYYAQGQYEIAIEEFLKVTSEHPGQDKEPAAFFKIALSFKALRDFPTARRYLQFLIERFPETREARLAREQLETF